MNRTVRAAWSSEGNQKPNPPPIIFICHDAIIIIALLLLDFHFTCTVKLNHRNPESESRIKQNRSIPSFCSFKLEPLILFTLLSHTQRQQEEGEIKIDREREREREINTT
jgi:hypothetical protein